MCAPNSWDCAGGKEGERTETKSEEGKWRNRGGKEKKQNKTKQTVKETEQATGRETHTERTGAIVAEQKSEGSGRRGVGKSQIFIGSN